MRVRGFSLVELVVVVGIMLTMAAVAIPSARSLLADSRLRGAGQEFRSQFRLAASAAVRGNVYTAIRFERHDAKMRFAVYRDGNHNGVLSEDIAAGRDTLVSGPFPLVTGPTVRVGFLPGIPAIPPDSGMLSGDPIRFGRSDILSFSPLGTATPGTFYLAGDGTQGAVRVNGTTARVRFMIYRGGRWLER